MYMGRIARWTCAGVWVRGSGPGDYPAVLAGGHRQRLRLGKRRRRGEVQTVLVRFLSAHLPDTQRRALLALVQEDGYEAQVKRTAQETAPDNCTSARWKTGWIAYWNAARGPRRGVLTCRRLTDAT